MKKILLILTVIFATACTRDYTCECKYSNKTTTHTVEAKDKFIAIGKCQSQDDKCHLAK